MKNRCMAGKCGKQEIPCGDWEFLRLIFASTAVGKRRNVPSDYCNFVGIRFQKNARIFFEKFHSISLQSWNG